MVHDAKTRGEALEGEEEGTGSSFSCGCSLTAVADPAERAIDCVSRRRIEISGEGRRTASTSP